MLILFCGMPGTGKSTLSRELASQLGAVYVRVDTIEQAIFDAMGQPAGEIGYRAGYAVAEENLRLGRTVIADSVNPLLITQNAWRAVAARAGVDWIDVEIICSDAEEHRRRVELRTPDIVGLRQPTWPEIKEREFQSLVEEHLVIDTAGRGIEESLAEINSALKYHQST